MESLGQTHGPARRLKVELRVDFEQHLDTLFHHSLNVLSPFKNLSIRDIQHQAEHSRTMEDMLPSTSDQRSASVGPINEATSINVVSASDECERLMSAPPTLGKRQRVDDGHDAAPDLSVKQQRLDGDNIDTEESLFVSQDPEPADESQLPNIESQGEESDDEELEETTEATSYYDSSLESYPEHPAFDNGFQQVLQDLEGLGKRAQKIIDDSGCQNRRVQGCRSNAIAASSAPEPPVFNIGLFGDTGSGKSSLLNSLLDMPSLAKAMSGGESCTHVVTRYRGPFPGQEKDFGVEIMYLDLETIREMFESMLENYNVFNFTPKKEQDWSEDEKQEYMRQSASALKTFRAIFCDKEALSSDKAAKAWLQNNKSAPSAILDSLLEWTQGKLCSFKTIGSEYRRYFESDNLDDFTETVEPLLFGTSHLDVPTLWPLVGGVRQVKKLHHL